MSFNKEELINYISQVRFLILATVSKCEEYYPAIRTIGGFANDGLTIYFSTDSDSQKIKQIKANPNVVAFFQQENQELSNFQNVTITGKAKQVIDKKSLRTAINVISNKNPRFKKRIEKGDDQSLAIFVIEPEKIKSLDFSRGNGNEAVQVHQVGACSLKDKKLTSKKTGYS